MAQTKLSTEIEEKRQLVFELQKVRVIPPNVQAIRSDFRYASNEPEQYTTSTVPNSRDERESEDDGGGTGQGGRRLRREHQVDRAFYSISNDMRSVFRHQAAAVERKKLAVAQKLQEARQELAQYEARVETKKREIRTRSGVDVISGKEVG